MKKISVLITSLMLITAAVTVNAAESNVDLKAGISYPADISKVGFDSALNFNLGLDKYFAIGLETGFNWVSWEKAIGDADLDGTPLTKVDTRNAFTIPVLALVRIRFDMKSDLGITPYIAGGAGYSWTFYQAQTDTTFSGFTWQAGAGCAFMMGEDSAMEIIAEAGYKGTSLENTDGYELPMSGAFARLGVRFGFGGDDY